MKGFDGNVVKYDSVKARVGASYSMLVFCGSAGDRSGALMLAGCNGLLHSRANLFEGHLEKATHQLLPLLGLN